MSTSSYSRAISSEVGDIERRLQALQNGLEKLGRRASSNARNSADGTGCAQKGTLFRPNTQGQPLTAVAKTYNVSHMTICGLQVYE